MFRLFFLSAIFFTTLCSYAKGDRKDARPMSEMQGDCSNYKINVSKELAQWKTPESAKTPADVKSLKVGEVYLLELKPEDDVKFLVAPAKKFPVEDHAHGEVFNLSVPKSGIYKVMASNKVWIDLIDRDAKVPAPEQGFEMQTQCQKIFKVVRMHLKKGPNYALQLSSGPKDTIELMVSAE